MQMLTLYQRLFSKLESQNINYAVWKNVQELPDALAGSSDIDLYIYPGCRSEFLSVLHSLQFIRVISHKSFPCVEHYYGYDASSGAFAHLHCYFKIVTGESHIKQYVVPIEQYLQTYPAVRNAQGICEMHPVLQKRLNIFRRKIKLSCLPGALLFFRERHGYQQEQELTARAVQSAAGEYNMASLSGWLAEMNESSLTSREMLDGLRYRFKFQHWNRFSPLMTPLHRYVAILIRLAGKLRKQKKTLPVGIILAITGTDSATVRQIDTLICNWLGKHLSIRSSSDPGGDSSLDTLYGKLMGAGNITETDQPVSTLSLACLTGITWQAWRWRRRVRQAVRWSMSGTIVICNFHEIEQLRHALQTVTRATPVQSSLKLRLLQICHSCLKITPAVNVRLHLGLSDQIQPMMPVTAVTNITQNTRPALRQCETETIPIILSTWSPGSHSDQNLADADRTEDIVRMKQELWETISSLQY